MSTAGKGGRRLVKKLIHTAKKVVTDPTTRQFVGQAVQAAQAAQKAFYSFSNDYHNRQISRSGGRPTTRHAKSTSTVSRKIVYSPDLDGKADPGEIVWTWVEFEDNAQEGKDRPVLVVGRDNTVLLGLMLSSKSYHHDDNNWQYLGTGSWDSHHRDSYVRLDRVLEVPEKGIRREGAILDRDRFEKVAQRLRTEYGWT